VSRKHDRAIRWTAHGDKGITGQWRDPSPHHTHSMLNDASARGKSILNKPGTRQTVCCRRAAQRIHTPWIAKLCSRCHRRSFPETNPKPAPCQRGHNTAPTRPQTVMCPQHTLIRTVGLSSSNRAFNSGCMIGWRSKTGGGLVLARLGEHRMLLIFSMHEGLPAFGDAAQLGHTPRVECINLPHTPYFEAATSWKSSFAAHSPPSHAVPLACPPSL
jgi:hypothetical protein